MSKLRILCLHGFSSNGSVHAHQVRSITSRLSKDFDFIFPDGPHVVDASKSLGNDPATQAWLEYFKAHSNTTHRAWWFAKDIPSAKAGSFVGLETSLDYLSSVIEKEGPVHAIWGFSQGACFAGILMSLLSEKSKSHDLRRLLPKNQGMPMAGVIFSGFRARFAQYDIIYEHGIDVPTLHVIGEKDVVVTAERSERLMAICKEPRVLRHKGGHDIPSSVEDQDVIVKFLLDSARRGKGESL